MQAFVSRTFTLDGEAVACVFDKPVPDGRDFRCDYRIAFPSGERRGYGFGVDEVQALLLAMSRAHLDLLGAPERAGAKLLWLDMERLGLPLPDNARPEDFSTNVGWCPRCDQGWIKRAEVRSDRTVLFVCAECDATWMRADDIAATGFVDLRTYLASKGLKGDWDLIELVPRPSA